MAANQTTYSTTKVAGAALPWRDLLVVLAGGLELLALVLLGELTPLLQPLRLLLGLAYVLYVPGYCLTAALFPRSDDLGGIERLGLSLGLSVAIVPLLALLLDRLPWGLRLWPILLGEYGVIMLCSAVAVVRRMRAKSGRAYVPELSWRLWPWWRSLPNLERRIYTLVAGTLLIALLCSTWVLLVPAPDSFMTEFYILGEQGRAEDYPRQAMPGQQIAITAGVSNHERAAANYRIEVWASDRWNAAQRVLVAQQGPIELAPGQEQRLPLSWSTPALGDDQSVELLLFRDGVAEPYRRLQLWVDVGSPP
jgi:uncharacterized membrane protein